jgi:ABC-type antimicrobial peptide transport system permease subunit
MNGRYFDATDYSAGPPALILSETAARALLPGRDPLGRTGVMDGVERTIVGVVGDVRHSGLETGPRMDVYMPWSQAQSGYGELVLRTSGNPLDVLAAVGSAIAAVFPDVPLREVRTMEEAVSRQTAQRRLNMLMLGLFGLLGLVISVVGIYGVMAGIVSQRTREIGVRMALGATRATVVRMVLGTAGVLVAAGLAIGSAGAWYLTAAAKAYLFGLDATDPRAFAAALATLALSALLASLVPAIRAASVDPVRALKAE